MSSSSLEEFDLAEDDKEKLKFLTCPVPFHETKRIAILQQTRLMESSPSEASYDRFTHLATLMFNMPVSLITLVDVDRVWFKSRIGVDWTDVCRNDSFDAYTVHPDYPEVFVVPDVSIDTRFKDCDLKYNNESIRFYAGAAIVVDDVRIGALCILDTEPHLDFSLEEKSNLLDLCVGVSQLALESRQHTLNLNADRANIVVSMMHNLRTPMTSLNFATSMLATEAYKLRPGAKSKTRGDSAAIEEEDDGSDDGVGGGIAAGQGALLRTPSSAAGNHLQAPSSRENSPVPTIPTNELTPTDAEGGSADSKGDSPVPSSGAPTAAAAATNVDNIESAFSTFDDCFREITSALKQLNLVVDSSLNLGQAIVKISEPPVHGYSANHYGSRDYLGSLSAGISEKSGLALASACLSAIHSAVPSANVSTHNSPKAIPKMGNFPPAGAAFTLYPEMESSRYTACNLLEHIENVYSTLVCQLVGVNVSWEVNPAYLGLGWHASHPEAVSLVLISSLGQLRSQHKQVRIRFHFEKAEHEEELEFPELANKLIEGMLIISIQAYTRSELAPKSPKRTAATDVASTNSSPLHADNVHSSLKTDASNKTSATSNSVAMSNISNVSERLQPTAPEQAGEDHNDYHSSYNLLSVNKVLRTINGGCKEYLEAVPELSNTRSTDKETELGDLGSPLPEPPVLVPSHQFWIPCKVMPSPEVLASMAGGDSLATGRGLSDVAGASDTLVKHFNESASVLTRWDSVMSRSSRSGKFPEGASTKVEPDTFSTSATSSSTKGTRNNTSPKNLKAGASEKTRNTLGSGITAVQEGVEGANSANKRSPTGKGSDNSAAEGEAKVLRVLIIEDTLSVQKLLSRWMQKANCKVTCASNGSLGLNQLTSACFDIVFVDFLMPVMLGVTTMKLFQAWMHEADPATNEVAAYNSQLLIVGMSATALESEQEAAFDYGMHFFCPKPTNMEILGLMLEAKRLCDTNEGALNMICDATGTDYCATPEEDELHTGRDRGDSADAEELSVSARGPAVHNLREGDRHSGIAATAAERDGNSAKSSEKGSGKSSGSGAISAAGGAPDPMLLLSSSASTTAFALGSSSGSFAGNSAGIGIGIAAHSPSHASPLQHMNSTAVTDSKSAAMWSVFRSYRQTKRTAVVGVSSSATTGAVAADGDSIAQP